MNMSLPSLGVSPFVLLIIWLILFIVLADISCPLFHTRYACTCHGENLCGRGTDD